MSIWTNLQCVAAEALFIVIFLTASAAFGG